MIRKKQLEDELDKGLRQLNKEYTQMANKSMRRCSMSYITKGLKVARYYFTLN